jgi:crotonobetainyl-CoA:carnitine CoA-transferase CaiB-like acyl-CoA transferase
MRKRAVGSAGTVLPDAPESKPMVAPLQGIRVLEIANWVAVPSAAALMADMGATVVKVEPPVGDPMRNKLRKAQRGRAPEDELDFAFQADNRGKRSIAVALDKPEGQQLIQRLLPNFDVVMTNLLPNRQRRFGLDPKRVHEIHPAIIHASLSAYGHRGEQCDATGFDVTAFFVRGGIADIVGDVEGPPARSRPGQGDHPTGLNLLSAILGALRLRDQTGQGQTVEISLLQTAVWSLACDVSVALMDEQPVERPTHTRQPSPLNQYWQCKDGRWIFIYDVPQRAKWSAFCLALDLPGLEDDPRFESPDAREKNAEVLLPMLAEVFRTRTLAEWQARLTSFAVANYPVTQLHEVGRDPQLLANDAFVEVEHARMGKFRTLGTPFRIVDADVRVRGPAPDLGQHTEGVLRELGVSDDELRQLIDAGTVRT